jgi:hypothetical protein
VGEVRTRHWWAAARGAKLAQMHQSLDSVRPLEEVIAFVSCSANDALWGSNLVEVTTVSPEVWARGPTSSGGRIR